MVQIWYMLDPVQDQFAENHLDPPEHLTVEELAVRTGVTCQTVEVDSGRQDELLNAVPEALKCNFRDVIEVSPEKMQDQFEEKLKIFFHEHLHTDDEIRFILDGGGFFDVRDFSDRWIRISVSKGDLIFLPAGIFHRFTTDKKRKLRAMRLFVGDPIWTPHNRNENAEKLPARKNYLIDTKNSQNRQSHQDPVSDAKKQ